ncbi:DNA-directed RNA polymerases II, IV and V subunit 12 [Lecanosticta acicola]|uniref:DNA-directed RNA polymerases II, IV and V subunit 12 n=1 Tax=Lecanosticta acicola TaxID=111012 RepID=A0AAI9EDW4_9PEZI|nr:DNA-directed RNA polymerases II, IV and V subunit 12 [Lecanosticta acicola]
MSREAFTPPSALQNNNVGGSSSSSQQQQGGFSITGAGSTFEDTSKPVQYLCGDCDHKVQLKKGDPIRCKECGYRVLYKERTNRSVEKLRAWNGKEGEC